MSELPFPFPCDEQIVLLTDDKEKKYTMTWTACDFIIDSFFMLSRFFDFALNKREASVKTGRLLR